MRCGRLSLFFTSAALAACHSSTNATSPPAPDAQAPEVDAGPYVPRFAPLDSDGKVLRDAQGRTVILRGYNIKVEGLFDVTPDNGDPVRETIPPLDDIDFTLM